ncbi:DUF3299 domain-containing protein [Pseudomonas cavernae]|uniref:DUF3299 domain-containing protein n=1 Tax=Pseudomonas cavernae TaxID=2320867 RepID=A0A385YXW8_9PSED|nr:DUF3299 domain-containing protein [Pseudomonas cavernae]AYC31414.1 DUF3299 domain-containing protein [Pseudomonas cavernae]
MLRRLLALTLLLSSPLWAAEPRELSWSELVPADAPPAAQAQAPIHDLAQLADALAAESAPAAKQQAPAAPVVKALDGQQVKIPGYIVPLDVSEEGRVTDFLLVPYFGACIHVPPPPSNQIVHVTSELGVQMDALYQPFWVEGPLQVEASSSELAEAGYQLAASKIYPYEISE